MRSLATLATLALLATPAAAQSGNPAGMQPGTPEIKPGVPKAHHPNTQDRLFIQLATNGGRAEVAMARLAQARATNGRVKELAKMMIEDHSKANDQLAELAKKADVPLPTALGRDHRVEQARLERMQGARFELAYVRAQLVNHQKTVQLLEWEILAGQDPALKQHASLTLPVVFHHLQMAQALVAELTATAPQGLAATRVRPREQADTRASVYRSSPHGMRK